MDVTLLNRSFEKKILKYYFREPKGQKLIPYTFFKKGKKKGQIRNLDDVDKFYRTYFVKNEKFYSIFVLDFIDNKPICRLNDSFIEMYKHSTHEEIDIENCIYNITSFHKSMNLPINDIYQLMN